MVSAPDSGEIPPVDVDIFEPEPDAAPAVSPLESSASTFRPSGPSRGEAPVHQGMMPDDVAELLHSREVVLFAQNPSRSALILRLILTGISLGIPLLPFLVVAARDGQALSACLAMTGLLGMGVMLLAVYLSWKNSFYVITDQRTVVRRGIFNRAIKIVLNANIQTMSINTGIIDRWLNLNSVQLETAAGGGGLAGILGVFGGFSSGGVVLTNVANAAEIVRCLYSEPMETVRSR
ncbi:MAG: PH domain-containing protein [Planctomycetaceae bacterium]